MWTPVRKTIDVVFVNLLMPVSMVLLPGIRHIGLYHEAPTGGRPWTWREKRTPLLEGELFLEILIGPTHMDRNKPPRGTSYVPTVAYLSAFLYNAWQNVCAVYMNVLLESTSWNLLSELTIMYVSLLSKGMRSVIWEYFMHR